MKTILAMMLVIGASCASAADLNTWNADTGPSNGLKVRNIPLGSGLPQGDSSTVTLSNATNMGNGLYQVPNYLPYYPTAAALWPRVVQVPCTADGICDGYTITPSIGRGEYIYIQPVVKR